MKHNMPQQPQLTISMIVAMDRNRAIGKDNDIPWKLPADQQYFKRVTMGRPIVMGRKNYESIRRPLPGRRNIVLTRDRQFQAPGCDIAHSAEEVLGWYANTEEHLFIIGGEQVYRQFMPLADRLYITEIDGQFPGDTFFPLFSEEDWELVSRQQGQTDDKNRHEHQYLIYHRRNAARN